MHDFHCDSIKNKYGNKSRLLFPVTDSLMYCIETENIYENFSNNKDIFGFIDFQLSQIILMI